MGFLCRIKQLKLTELSRQAKRFYLGTPSFFLHNYAAANSMADITNKSNQFIHRRQIEFFDRVRFFAAPVQAKKVVSESSSTEPRLNEQIAAQFIRLVTDAGHGVLPKNEALQRARSLKLDLVEVDHTAKPPVCKIMDFNKERYKQQLKEKEKAKNKSTLKLRKGDSKEIRFTPKTEVKDLQTKANMATRLMERGYRVRLVAVGDEDQDLGGLLGRLSAMLEDVAFVESGPRVEKKQAYLIARHVKFGPTKKGKKMSITEVLKSSTSVQSYSQESGMEDEDDTTVVGQDGPIQSASAANEEFNEVCEMKSNASPLVNANASESLLPRVPKFMGPNSNPSSSQPVTQNRYKQNVTSGPSPSDSRRSPSYAGQPQPSSNLPPSVQPTRRINVDTHVSRNLKSHHQFPQHGSPSHKEQYKPNGNISVPSAGTRTSGNIGQPRNQVPKQEQTIPSRPASKLTDFGIFSTPKPNSFTKDSGVGQDQNGTPKSNVRSQWE